MEKKTQSCRNCIRSSEGRHFSSVLRTWLNQWQHHAFPLHAPALLLPATSPDTQTCINLEVACRGPCATPRERKQPSLTPGLTCHQLLPAEMHEAAQQVSYSSFPGVWELLVYFVFVWKTNFCLVAICNHPWLPINHCNDKGGCIISI